MTVPLDELRTLLEAATPRPWKWEMTAAGVPLIVTVDDAPETTQAVAETGFNVPEENAALIVAAVNHLDALIACAEALKPIAVRECEGPGSRWGGTCQDRLARGLVDPDNPFAPCDPCHARAALAALSQGQSA